MVLVMVTVIVVVVVVVVALAMVILIESGKLTENRPNTTHWHAFAPQNFQFFVSFRKCSFVQNFFGFCSSGEKFAETSPISAIFL